MSGINWEFHAIKDKKEEAATRFAAVGLLLFAETRSENGVTINEALEMADIGPSAKTSPGFLAWSILLDKRPTKEWCPDDLLDAMESLGVGEEWLPW